MSEIIGARSCKSCKFAHQALNEGGELGIECRRLPPSAIPILRMTPQGPQVMGKIQMFPSVNEEIWCYEYAANPILPFKKG